MYREFGDGLDGIDDDSMPDWFRGWADEKDYLWRSGATRFGGPVSQTCDAVPVIFAWAASAGRHWAIGR